MKVSFDFDGTLSRKDVQVFAKNLVNSGYDVWIVTSRIATEPALKKGWHWIERQNQELFDAAKSVGIVREKIVFTEFVYKIEFLKDKGFIFHIDDDVDELMAILDSKDSCRTVNVDHFEWEESCKNILKKFA